MLSVLLFLQLHSFCHHNRFLIFLVYVVVYIYICRYISLVVDANVTAIVFKCSLLHWFSIGSACAATLLGADLDAASWCNLSRASSVLHPSNVLTIFSTCLDRTFHT